VNSERKTTGIGEGGGEHLTLKRAPGQRELVDGYGGLESEVGMATLAGAQGRWAQALWRDAQQQRMREKQSGENQPTTSAEPAA